MVAVSNQGDRSVTLLELGQRGELSEVGTIPLDATPGALAWHGRRLFVVEDRPFPQEDVIRAFHVRDREVVDVGNTPAGVFLTDIKVQRDRLVAVTANLNTDNPLDARNEIRTFRIEGPDLVPDASVQTEGFPPSFKQVAARRGRGGIWHVLVTEFQAGWLRSLIYEPDEP